MVSLKKHTDEGGTLISKTMVSIEKWGKEIRSYTFILPSNQK